MDLILTLLQESIRSSPGEWLWQHNRWKQHTPQIVYKRFRQDSILIILPKERPDLLPHLKTFREIYPLGFLFLLAPIELKNQPLFDADEIIYYEHPKKGTLLEDFRFKLVFDFTESPKVRSHYERLSAFETIHLKAESPHNLSETLKRSLCRPGTLWHA